MENWKEIDEQNIWHPFTPLQGQQPIYVRKAKGAYLHTRDGKKILDLISSWWVTILGHGNKQIAKAIAKQARKMEQVIFAGFTHKPALKLSELLLSALPSDQSKLFFSDDGSTSTEVAIKLALQYWHNAGKPRKKVIALDGAYHGDTFGAMSVGGRSIFTEPFNNHLFEVEFLPFPKGDGSEAIQKMKEVASDDVAAFIFEPLVQGAGGMRMYSPEVLDQLIGIARNQNIICIADEVMTGFGRTAKTFASNYLKEKPDIFCLSKGLTGGFLPMGITTVNKKVAEAFDNDVREKTFFHGHSYTANPIACAAACASFDILHQESTQESIAKLKENHAQFHKRIEGHERLVDIRQTGTIFAMEIAVQDGGYSSNIRETIYRHFLEKDMLMRPLGNVLYFLPPYVIKNRDMQKAYDEVESFLHSLS